MFGNPLNENFLGCKEHHEDRGASSGLRDCSAQSVDKPLTQTVSVPAGILRNTFPEFVDLGDFASCEILGHREQGSETVACWADRYVGEMEASPELQPSTIAHARRIVGYYITPHLGDRSIYASKTAAPSVRAQRDAQMMPILLALFVANYRVYGARKLWIAAGRGGHEIGRDQVARLMKALDIEDVTRRRKSVVISNVGMSGVFGVVFGGERLQLGDGG